MNRHHVRFVAWTSAVSHDELLEEPKAPSNYGPDAAEKYVAKRRLELLTRSSQIPLVATLTTVTVQDALGGNHFHFSSTTPGTTAGQFLGWLRNNYGHQLADIHDPDYALHIHVPVPADDLFLVGCDLKSFLRVLIGDLCHSRIDFPAGLWYATSDWSFDLDQLPCFQAPVNTDTLFEQWFQLDPRDKGTIAYQLHLGRELTRMYSVVSIPKSDLSDVPDWTATI